MLAAKKALSIGWDGKSCQSWNHSQFVSWLPSLLLTLGPSVTLNGPHGGISLPLEAFLPLLIVKVQGNKDLIFFSQFYPLFCRCVCKANSGGHSATCTASHLPWGHTLPQECISKNASLLQMTGFQLCLYPTDAGAQGSVRLQRLLRGGNVVARVGGILSAQVGLLAKILLLDQSQGPRQARKCFVSSLVIPGRLDPSPAAQHRNVLCAAPAYHKIELR